MSSPEVKGERREENYFSFMSVAVDARRQHHFLLSATILRYSTTSAISVPNDFAIRLLTEHILHSIRPYATMLRFVPPGTNAVYRSLVQYT